MAEDAGKVDLTDEITLYALSTCMWCKKTKALLDSKGVAYTCHFVNELTGEEQEKAKAAVAELNPNRSYPTMVIDGDVIVGFKPEQIEAAVDACIKKKSG